MHAQVKPSCETDGLNCLGIFVTGVKELLGRFLACIQMPNTGCWANEKILYLYPADA